MATTTVFPAVDRDQALCSAQAKRAPIRAALDAALAQQSEIRATVSPTVEQRRNTTDVAYFQAKAVQAEVDRRVSQLTADDLVAARAEADAREAAVAKLQAAYVAADADDVRELAALLDRAKGVEARRVARWTAFEQAAHGRQPTSDPGWWGALHPGGMLDVWLAWARRERGLDEK